MGLFGKSQERNPKDMVSSEKFDRMCSGSIQQVNLEALILI